MTLLGIDAGQLALTFAVATTVTAVELITSKYPRTANFVVTSGWFYAYVLVYGILGAAALSIAPLTGADVTSDAGILNNPWAKAAIIGFSIKAFLHIRIFTVTTGPGQSFPVGLESFVQLFEPWLLNTIDLDHYFKQRAFITPRAARFANVIDARNQALGAIPTGFSPQEKAALTSDINQATTSEEVIRSYLKYTGIKLTKDTFPS